MKTGIQGPLSACSTNEEEQIHEETEETTEIGNKSTTEEINIIMMWSENPVK